MVLKSKYWLPPALQPGGNVRYIKGSSFEQETILGWFLRLSSLPKDFNASVPVGLIVYNINWKEFYTYNINVNSKNVKLTI